MTCWGRVGARVAALCVALGVAAGGIAAANRDKSVASYGGRISSSLRRAYAHAVSNGFSEALREARKAFEAAVWGPRQKKLASDVFAQLRAHIAGLSYYLGDHAEAKKEILLALSIDPCVVPPRRLYDTFDQFFADVKKRKKLKGQCPATVPAPSAPAPITPAPVTPAARCPKGMAFIEGGMDEAERGDKKKHVTVEDFCLDITEVTVKDYHACTTCPALNWFSRLKLFNQCNGDKPDRQDHPRHCVSWREARGRCQQREGARLPTENEFEWAARGLSEGRKHVWGNDDPTRPFCWDGESSDLGKGKRNSTCPVGAYPVGDVNPRGVLDLAGNVLEWTEDREGSARVVRGGSWEARDVEDVRVAWRRRLGPAGRGSHLGFRCARTPLR